MSKLEEAKATGTDSESIDPTTGAGGTVKKRKADLFKSAYSVDDIEKNVKTPQGSNNAGLHEALDAIFGETDLPEDFKAKISTVFEAAVNETVSEIVAELEEEIEAKYQADAESVVEELTDKIDGYLDYVVESWKEENAVALESGLKVTMAESFFASLKGLMEEHNFDLDEEIFAAGEEVAEENEALRERYNSSVENLLALQEENEKLKRTIIISEMSEGLIDTDADRLLELSESVSFNDENTFRQKVSVLKESHFKPKVNRAADDTKLLSEEAEDNVKPAPQEVSLYVRDLDRLKK